jgi:amino acid transporter
VSGLQYLAGLFPALDSWLVPGACAAIILLGMLNYVGVRESAILLISPLATALETALLKASEVNPDRFMFELGAAFGPRSLQLAIVATSAALLLGAANTALIGCYHVFLALVRLGYLPRWLSGRGQR